MPDVESITANGRFEIDLMPGDALVPDSARLDLTKTWTGEIDGRSVGAMLSGGDPGSGEAGYIAIERFEGSIASRTGTVLLQQFGTMSGGEVELRYGIVPGSGTGELTGITGRIQLEVEDGDHTVTIHAIVAN